MRRTGGRLIRAVVAGILFLLLFCAANASAERKLTAGCPSVCSATVTARWQKDEIVLSLPGSWDLSKVTLETAEGGTLLLGNKMTPVLPGEPTDLTGFIGKRTVIRNEEKRSLGYLMVLQGSRIPALFLEVDADDLVRVNGNKKEQITEGRAVYIEADSTVIYDGGLEQLKSRGNATFWENKKPYQFKLKKKTALSGMSKAKTWVLLANFWDSTMIRNQVVLDMSREVGLKNALKCVQADLWINGQYQGLYLMTEKIQISRERINIANLEKETEKVNPSPFDPGEAELEMSKTYPLLRSYPKVIDPEDITGGYILTIEKTHRMKLEQAGFRNTEDLSIQIKEPTYPSRKQTEYVYDLITGMQKALMAEDGVNPDTGKSYEEYIDVTSFAQRYLFEEWSANYDFLGGSQNLYKDSDRNDPFIYAGPSWDYDLCFGNRKDKGYRTTDDYLTAFRYRQNLNIFWLLYNHAPFLEKTCILWQKDFRPVIDVLLGEKEAAEDSIVRSLDDYRDRIRESAVMNYVRWHAGASSAYRAAEGHLVSAVKYMKKWITERTAWMDKTYHTDTVIDD